MKVAKKGFRDRACLLSTGLQLQSLDLHTRWGDISVHSSSVSFILAILSNILQIRNISVFLLSTTNVTTIEVGRIEYENECWDKISKLGHRKSGNLGLQLNWQNVCLTCTKSQVQSLAPHKLIHSDTLVVPAFERCKGIRSSRSPLLGASCDWRGL